MFEQDNSKRICSLFFNLETGLDLFHACRWLSKSETSGFLLYETFQESMQGLHITAQWDKTLCASVCRVCFVARVRGSSTGGPFCSSLLPSSPFFPSNSSYSIEYWWKGCRSYPAHQSCPAILVTWEGQGDEDLPHYFSVMYDHDVFGQHRLEIKSTQWTKVQTLT